MRLRSVVMMAVMALAVGCGASRNHALRRQASVDLQCAEGQVHVSTVNKGKEQFLAEGCTRRAVYTFSKGTGAVRISEIEGQPLLQAPSAVVPVQGGNVSPPPPPPPPPAP